jgi:HAD superfamily hydrolase (TIGR01509 family)
MKTYQAVLLDMFDTLVNFNSQRLPLVQINGQEVRSTSPYVYEALKPLCPRVTLPEFYQAFVEAFRAAEEIRNRDQREVTAHERFRLLFQRLEISDGPEIARFINIGIAEHTRQLARAMEFPDSHRDVLVALRQRYRLAVVSNFDHGPTVETALDSHGIRQQFEAVVVSADVGWRKPRPEIFAETLRRLGLRPEEVIFVGDTPEVDVVGAQAAGMHVIWIDHGTKPIPPGTPAPTYTVSAFTDIKQIL